MGPVLRFLESSRQSCTIVVLDIYPRNYWWPLLNAKSVKARKIASRSNPHALLVPSRQGWLSNSPLTGDLWALPSNFEFLKDDTFYFLLGTSNNGEIVCPISTMPGM